MEEVAVLEGDPVRWARQDLVDEALALLGCLLVCEFVLQWFTTAPAAFCPTVDPIFCPIFWPT